MDDDDDPLDPYTGPINDEEVAYEELEKAVAKLSEAALEYQTATGSSSDQARARYMTKLNKALIKAKRLYNEANTYIYQVTAQQYIDLITPVLNEFKKLDDSQSGGSRRRRIKSARKKSKRHKKTHRRKH